MNLRTVRRLVERNPEISLGVLIFAGFALGTGMIPIPTLAIPRVAPPAPAPASSPSGTASVATPGAQSSAVPPAPAADGWWAD